MKLLLLVTLLTGATAHSISHQTAQRFGTAFDCYSKSNISTMNIHPWPVSKIFGFMCHTPNFSPHVDDIARCCERHDRCYEEAKKLGGCTISEDNRYDIPYYYSCSGRELICSDRFTSGNAGFSLALGMFGRGTEVTRTVNI